MTDGDFALLLMRVYRQITLEIPIDRARQARSEGAAALVVLLAWRSRNFREAHARFEAISAEVESLAPEVDRDRVYRALSAGVVLCDDVTAHSPTLLRDAQDDLRRLRRSLARLGREHLVEDLERKLTDDLRAREQLAPSRGGRPRALWREHTLDLLRAEGVPIEAARALLQAAGLADRTPSQQQHTTTPKRHRR